MCHLFELSPCPLVMTDVMPCTTPLWRHDCPAPTSTILVHQVPVAYEELEPRFYEELEARVEECVREALYGACEGCWSGQSPPWKQTWQTSQVCVLAAYSELVMLADHIRQLPRSMPSLTTPLLSPCTTHYPSVLQKVTDDDLFQSGGRGMK